MTCWAAGAQPVCDIHGIGYGTNLCEACRDLARVEAQRRKQDAEDFFEWNNCEYERWQTCIHCCDSEWRRTCWCR